MVCIPVIEVTENGACVLNELAINLLGSAMIIVVIAVCLFMASRILRGILFKKKVEELDVENRKVICHHCGAKVKLRFGECPKCEGQVRKKNK